MIRDAAYQALFALFDVIDNLVHAALCIADGVMGYGGRFRDDGTSAN